MLKTHAPLISLLMFSNIAFAGETGGLFYFFKGKDIDYWNQGKTVKDPLFIVRPKEKTSQENHSFSGANVLRSGDTQEFAWENYRDPRKPEFWDDGGDWIPPRPFREAAANPTKKNISEYLSWQKRKAGVVENFQDALSSQVDWSKQFHGRKEDIQENIAFKWNEVRIAYFYQSGCAHCRESMPALSEAQEKGAQVTFIQLDYAKNPPLHPDSIPYDSSWSETFPVSSTPTWVFKYGEETSIVAGALSFGQIDETLQKLAVKGITQ